MSTKGSRAFVLLVLCSFAAMGAAQQVKVYDPPPPQSGSTPQDGVTPDDTNQRLLFIPVVTQDTTTWDPNNNTLPAATLTDLQNKATQVSSFWSENSYGRVSFQSEIAPRVYQMPRGRSHYFNPSYVVPRLDGTAVQGPSITVPAGKVRLQLHVTDADQTAIDVNFTAAESPFTLDALQMKVCNTITTAVGDKITCTFPALGANVKRFNFIVAQPYVVAGSYLHVDLANSDAPVLDALGLDRPVQDLTAPEIGLDTRGAQFPATTTAGNITLTLENTLGTAETFVWTVPAQTFNNAADLIAAIGSGTPNGTVTASGGELRFTVTPSIAAPFKSITASGAAATLDALGLAHADEFDGVISYPARNTVRGDRRLIAGQAIAAMVLNELTRPHTDPGPDPYPNMAITAANEAAINTLVQTRIDPNRTFIVVFLDGPPSQREGAAGGFIDAGIENGAYTWHYQFFGGLQVIYALTTPADTIAHELGHNIGFYDLYNNSNDYLPNYQYANNWDVMHASGLLPHTAFWHKEIIARWLTNGGATASTFADPAMGAETRQYVLTPIEMSVASYDNSLAAVAGRTETKAIRLPLGLGDPSNHHYLVIQNRQSGSMFSQDLPQKPGAPAKGGVYIEDAISTSAWLSNLMGPTTRNVVHPITDVPVLASGDVTPIRDSAPNPDVNLLMTYPAYDGITVNIAGEVAGPGGFAARPSYLIDVTREQKDYLDLAITPWGAPPYESVDIWVEHADGSLSATPLPGNGEPTRWSATYNPAANGGNPLNWIRVKVTNAGTVDATNVKVRVKVNQPGGMGDTGTWVSLPLSDPQNIPHGQSRIFNLPWTPKVNQHTCVQAEVAAYDSMLGDRDPWNQHTQENVNDFNPTSSSPWTPVAMEFDIANKRATPIEVALETHDLPPGYLVQFDPAFLIIPGKTKVRVNATLTLDSNVIPTPSAERPRPPKPGMFHLTASLMNDEYQLPMGGITYRVFPDRKINATVTTTVDANGNIVVDGTTNPAAPGDHIEILVCYPSGKCEWVETTTDGSGNVHVVIPPKEAGSVNVGVYLPPNYGPGRLDETTVDTTKPGTSGGGGGHGGAHEFGIFVGGFFPASKTLLESGLDTGFRYGRFLQPQLSAEGEFGIVFTRRLGQRGLLAHAQAQALWHAGNAMQPVRPFLLAGLGFASFHTPSGSDSAPLLAVGVGADFRWRPDVGFRFDARDLVMFDLVGAGTTHNIEVLWGVTFRF